MKSRNRSASELHSSPFTLHPFFFLNPEPYFLPPFPALRFGAMSQPLGKLCIVLHAHLPYVLHHGETPHGEAWLFEAAAETYLPLLDLIGEVRCTSAARR